MICLIMGSAKTIKQFLFTVKFKYRPLVVRKQFFSTSVDQAINVISERDARQMLPAFLPNYSSSRCVYLFIARYASFLKFFTINYSDHYSACLNVSR